LNLLIPVLFCTLALPACNQRDPQQAQTPVPAGLYVPEGARNVQQRERQGIQEISYNVAAAYPASPFLCELTNYVDRQQWRGLREDALNPGSESSLVSGWGDYGNATRQPETHVHAWMSQWLNQQGDLLTYALQYEYPEAGTPDLSTLKVSALIWPAKLVRAQHGSRTDQLSALMIPATTVVLAKAGESPNDRPCVQPQWSQFVNSKSERAAPVLALPFELARVRSIDIQSDIDGLAGRIAATLKAQVPDLRVRTVHDRTSEPSDATLDFRAECRCNEAGAPNGFYVREAVLYKHGIQREWTEPARVLFYWTDAGNPAWKSKVPASCIGQKALSQVCKAAFEEADVAFAVALSSTLIDVQNRR
jgi:hypothetical protein